jgi:hypothetical protein
MKSKYPLEKMETMARVRKPKPELTPEQLIAKQIKDEEKLAQRIKDDYARNTLSRILSGATLAEKIEAIREFNPYFYLLTPKPKKEKQDESN